MTRTIAVKDSDGNDDYVVIEEASTTEFYLSTGEALILESAERFTDPATSLSYHAVDDKDIEWLLSL
ncbi:hypothetical protein ACT3UJ_02480 [Halomonas sp. 86]|uniref:hypothetical protein n=1 Tax=unclassified Halomonas TaxID=2609666 RepID=UPI0040332342